MNRIKRKPRVRREGLTGKGAVFGVPWQSFPPAGQEICRLYHVLEDRTGDGRGEF